MDGRADILSKCFHNIKDSISHRTTSNSGGVACHLCPLYPYLKWLPRM